jgi:glycosyltransferase involved in cell wall biosynthesis
MPAITVVIPNYNHARFLDRRIQSVLDQTRGDFELLLLDDRSTDNSLEVFDRYRGDPRVRVILNPVNSGSTFRQWNKGIAEARGRYVWFAESDDHAAPEFLATLTGLLDQSPGVVLAFCESIVVDADDQPSGLATDYVDRVMAFEAWDIDRDLWRRDFLMSGRDYCIRAQGRASTIPNASAVVFRREAYLAVGGADPAMRATGDWLLWGRMMLQGDVAFMARPMNFFRSHAQTTRERFDRLNFVHRESLATRVALVNAMGLTAEERAPWLANVADACRMMAFSPRFELRYNLEALRLAQALSPAMAREHGLNLRRLARVWGGRVLGRLKRRPDPGSPAGEVRP